MGSGQFARKAAQLALRAIRGIRRAVLRPWVRYCFRSTGKRFVFDPDGYYSFETITVGDDVYIGPEAILSAPLSSITIGSKVVIGPRVTMMGGDHNFRVVGQYIADVTLKGASDDQPIVIEDDVWFGANVTVLKGVTIATGSVIGAGSVVTRSVPAYSVAAGNPARVIRPRFSKQELSEHVERLRRTRTSEN